MWSPARGCTVLQRPGAHRRPSGCASCLTWIAGRASGETCPEELTTLRGQYQASGAGHQQPRRPVRAERGAHGADS
jgi:hypothetical protein